MKKIFQTYGSLVALVILLVLNFMFMRGTFFGPENIRNIVTQNSPTGIVAVGMTLVIIGGGIDLSVGSMMVLVATLGLLALNKTGNLQTGTLGATIVTICHSRFGWSFEQIGTFIAAIVTVAGGAALGLVNGMVITSGRIAPFIVTLAGLISYRSVALALAEGGEIRSSSATVFSKIAMGGVPIPGTSNGAGGQILIYWPIVIMIVMVIWGSFILNQTKFGRRLIAVGANEQAALYSGIAVHKVKWATYSFLGLCTGIAALCQASKFNSVSTSGLGLYMELDAIAAVVIGGTSMRGGRGQVWSTLIGVLILGIITNMLVLYGVSVYWQGCVKGAIILIAVLIQRGKTE